MAKMMKFSLRRSLSSLFSWRQKKQSKGKPVLRYAAAAEMTKSSAAKEVSADPTELPPVIADKENQQQVFCQQLSSPSSSYTSLRDLMPPATSGHRPISPSKQMKRESLTGTERWQQRQQQQQQQQQELEADENNFHGTTPPRPPIKNRLVEQAARAYLLPATAAQTAPPDQFLARCWAKLTSSGSVRGYGSSSRNYSEDWFFSGGGGGAPEAVTHASSGSCCSSSHELSGSSFSSCLPSFPWLFDFTRIFHCLFRNVRPQSVSFLRA